MQYTGALQDGEREMKKLALDLDGLDERELGRMTVHYPRTDYPCTGWSDSQQNLAIAETQIFPKIVYDVTCGGVDKSVKSTVDRFTLLLTDPDAPCRHEPLFREFIHLVVTDLTAADLAAGVTADTGNHIVPYLGPAPPSNSGFHRYVFLLFEQPEGSDPSVLQQAFEGRGGKKSVVEAHMCGLAGPIGVGGFCAQWSQECDELHEKMGWLPPPQYQSEAQKQAVAKSE